MSDLQSLYETHRSAIETATAAIHSRVFHAQWPEPPSGKIYGETAQADGEAQFKARLNARFEDLKQDAVSWAGSELSPYGFPLNVQYPVLPTESYVERASAVFRPWARLQPRERAGLLMEALVRSSRHFFEIGYATMHTTGQGFIMAFQASGPHAYDRALEALALGLHEQTRFTDSTEWEKPMGKMSVRLQKTFRAVGRGPALVIGCSTFPIWNSFPAIFANLVCGNPVIVKPHPGAVLPIAVAVADIRAALRDNTIDPDVIQLAVDGDTPIALQLAQHPSVRLIDYTGNSAFGEQLERIPDKIVFTEKAGVNSVLLDSVDDLDAALDNLAFSVSLYSGQMCTTPQNIFIPKNGVREKESLVGYSDVCSRFVAKLEALVGNEKMGPGTLGAIQNPATVERVDSMSDTGCSMLRAAAPVVHAGFDAARSLSPLVLEVPAERADVYRRELFGPIVCIVPVDDTAHGLALAASAAREQGAITFAAYCTDAHVRAHIADEMAFAGAPVSFNLTGPIWVNQSATFSDFHVSGGNPAGNASLTDVAFVARRFYIATTRIPV